MQVKNEQIAKHLKTIHEQKLRIESLVDQLESRASDRIQLTSDMSRMYKSMQTQLNAKIESQDVEIDELKEKVAALQAEREALKLAGEKTVEEKDAIIDEQGIKMSYMSNEFEQMLNDTLSKMTKRIELVSSRWKESEGLKISEASQKRLADFSISKFH